MDAFTAQQTIELVSHIGCKKAHMRIGKLFFNSFIAGPLLGFGSAWLLSTNAAPWYQENAPGLIRTIGGLVFPIGLVMIVLTGADLFTTNIMFMTTAFLHRRVSVIDVGMSWFVSFFGNLAGTLFFMAIITGYGGVFEETEEYRQAAINLAVQRAQQPQWHQIFLRAIGANWLVCLAVFLSISAREISSKIMAIWFPTACFVGLALDHVVANMFFIPMGIWCGAPFSVGYYIWKSMIPTALGNMVGGGLFVGIVYWYLYLTGEVAAQAKSDIESVATTTEAGEPMRQEGKARRNSTAVRASDLATVIEAQDSEGSQEDLQASQEDLQASQGNLQALQVSLKASRGNLQALRGNPQASRGNLQASQGNLQALQRNSQASQGSSTSSEHVSPAPEGGRVVSAFHEELDDHTPNEKAHAERKSEESSVTESV